VELLNYSDFAKTGFLIQERSFALVFTASHSIADARYFGNPIFAARYAALRSFAAKFCATVE